MCVGLCCVIVFVLKYVGFDLVVKDVMEMFIMMVEECRFCMMVINSLVEDLIMKIRC